MGKRLFPGDLSPLPDNLRCRRSDGRQWRCPQPAKSGLSFCEYHYHQVRRSQENMKSTNVATEGSAEHKRRLLLKADPPLAKKLRRKRLRKDPPAAEPIWSGKIEGGEVERESSDLKANRDLPLLDQLRHLQSDSREWRCSQLAMPVLNFCDRHHLRCKQPNVENNKLIELKPKSRPRLATDLMPSIKRRRRRRLKGETREEQPIRKVQREEAEGDMEVAVPAVTRGLPVPDPLQCRRSDGRKWRCTLPAMPGLSFCEYHQMRCKQNYNKNTKVKISKHERGSHLTSDLRRLTKRRRRRIEEQPAEDLMRTKQNEEGLEVAKPDTPGLNSYDKNLLFCKEDNIKNKQAEQREEEVEVTKPATPSVSVCDNDPLSCEKDSNKDKEAATKPNHRFQLAGDPQPLKKNLFLPDHLRCRRSDGRKWRCTQLAMPSVGFCEYHYLQVRRNQGKRKNTKLASASKCKQRLRRQRLRGQPQGEEPKRTAQEDGDEGMEAADLEVTRDLPNGVMAISPALARGPANASPSLDWKVWSGDGYLLGRRFRSKNAERVPLGTLQRLPFFRSVGGRRKRVCHRCRASENKVERRIRCLSCQEFFCTTCIETWHFELSELEVKVFCPVCRGCCSCMNCNSRRDEDGGSKKLVIHQNKFGTTRYDNRLICDLIPLLKHINGEQINELEVESSNQGKRVLDALVKVVKYSDNEQINCNNCRTKINDFHRSCSMCTYRFCLSCCQKIRVGSFTKGNGTAVCEYSKRRHAYYRVDKAVNGKKVGLSSRKHVNTSALCTSSVLLDWITNKDGSISCPPKELGGCGVGILNINFAIMSSSAKFISE